MQSAWLGLLDDQQLRRGLQGISLAGVSYQKTGIGVKPTHAHVGMAGMVSVLPWPDAEFAAVGVVKDAVSWTYGGVVSRCWHGSR